MRSLLLALAAAAALSSTAAAGDALGHRAQLFFGPIMTTQPLRLDLRTTVPSTPVFLFFGTNGTPFVPSGPGLPVFGLNPFTAHSVLLFTDAAGRILIVAPPVSPLPAATGIKLYFQALLRTQDGQKIVSNVKATEIQPPPVAPFFLTDVAASNLPAGWDLLGGAGVDHADLNGDGFPDLVIALDAGVALWLNDGHGSFSDASGGLPFPGDALNAIATGDIDGDGDVDLLTGGGFDDFVSLPDRLWRNDGSGNFTQEPTFPAGLGLTKTFELGDYDMDGDLDVAVAAIPEGQLPVPGGQCRLLRNDGAGHFTEDAAFFAGAWNSASAGGTALRTGDIDSDGDLDLLVARGNPAQADVLLRNDGTAHFTDISSNMVPLLVDNTQDATFADIDNDGDLDLLKANSVFSTPTSQSSDVMINQGGAQGGTQGVFVDDPASFLEATTGADGIRLTIQAADIDVDGDLDVLVTVHELGGADHGLFLNQGGAQNGVVGKFVRQTWFDPGDVISFGATIFDMDHDGDLEILMTAGGSIIATPPDPFAVRLFQNTQL
jgi:hypothetical protein